MQRILVLATGGAGGDVHPLLAVALALGHRGHEVVVFGDAAVAATVQALGLVTVVSLPEHDIGPRLLTASKDAQGLEASAQGALLRQRLALWSADLAPVVQRLLRERAPDGVLTSLLGASVASLACAQATSPWCVINSTFYIGPHPPRPVESDFAPRVIPVVHYFSSFLAEAPLVLHATDHLFDYHSQHLPAHHRYVGPLLWEAEAPLPGYLDAPGAPWVLVTISSQLQDDLPLARAALTVLEHYPVRVLLTLGAGHQRAELGPLPANAHVEHYVPHTHVLERSLLLISHAGHGSVMKALWHGVPMVLMPWGRDQPGVAARAARLGVAHVVARDLVTDARLAETVHRVLEDRDMRDAASDVARRLRTHDPVATACAFLEHV